MHIPLVLIDTCVRACSFPRLRLIVIKSKYYFNDCIRKGEGKGIWRQRHVEGEER